MIRVQLAAMLVMASTAAHAQRAVDFEVDGQKIHIGAARGCDALSCVSVSIPGVFEMGPKRRPGGRAGYDLLGEALAGFMPPGWATPGSPPTGSPVPVNDTTDEGFVSIRGNVYVHFSWFPPSAGNEEVEGYAPGNDCCMGFQ